jgi:subfamily B ATP-binding cassette protein MsbA
VTRPPRSDLVRRLLAYVRPYWRSFALGVSMMVLYAATEAALPALLKELLDGSFVAKDPQAIHLMPLLIVLLFAVRGIADFGHTVALSSVATKVLVDLRTQVFDKLMNLPTSYFDAHASAATVSKLTHNTAQVSPLVTNVLITLVKDSLTVLGLLGYMLYLNWRLSLLFFTVLPLIAWVIRTVSKRLRGLSREQQKAQAEMARVAHEALGAHR